jgi:hypothetical protein
MTAAHLALGLVLVALGAFMVAARDRVVARHVRLRGRSSMPATGWAVLGVLFLFVGALQIALAFL